MTNKKNILHKEIQVFPRILAGKWKSRLLKISKTAQIRPTLSRHRLRLFDWLSSEIKESRVLDLYSGSGALGFEALSRDAHYAELVEKNFHQTKFLNDFKNLVNANCNIFADNVLNYLQNKAPTPFDIIFIDFPFGEECFDKIIPLLICNNYIKDQGLIYCETRRNAEMKAFSKKFLIVKEKIFKNLELRIYQYIRQVR